MTGVLRVASVLSGTNVVILFELLANILGFDCDSDTSGRIVHPTRLHINHTSTTTEINNDDDSSDDYTIFSDILSPESVFGSPMTDSEISIHQALIAAAFDSSTSDTSTNGTNGFCFNIPYSQMELVHLLEQPISTRLPSNSLINLEDTTNNRYYTVRARRRSPGTQID